MIKKFVYGGKNFDEYIKNEMRKIAEDYEKYSIDIDESGNVETFYLEQEITRCIIFYNDKYIIAEIRQSVKKPTDKRFWKQVTYRNTPQILRQKFR